jgi:hypothetical protein
LYTYRSINNSHAVQLNGTGRNPAVGHIKQKDMPKIYNVSQRSLFLFVNGLSSNAITTNCQMVEMFMRNWQEFGKRWL